jgi:hypothetical protein
MSSLEMNKRLQIWYLFRHLRALLTSHALAQILCTFETQRGMCFAKTLDPNFPREEYFLFFAENC